MCDRQQASKTYRCKCPQQRRKCGTCPKAVHHSFEANRGDDCRCPSQTRESWFTLVINNFTQTQDIQAHASKSGNFVELFIPKFTGVKDGAGSLILFSLPGDLRPKKVQDQLHVVQINNSPTLASGRVQIQSDGDVVIFANADDGDFSNENVVGLANGTVVTYFLA